MTVNKLLYLHNEKSQQDIVAALSVSIADTLMLDEEGDVADYLIR